MEWRFSTAVRITYNGQLHWAMSYANLWVRSPLYEYLSQSQGWSWAHGVSQGLITNLIVSRTMRLGMAIQRFMCPSEGQMVTHASSQNLDI